MLKSPSPVSHVFESRDCTVTCKLNFNLFSFLLLHPPPTLHTTPRPWRDEDEGVEGRRRDGQGGRGGWGTRLRGWAYKVRPPNFPFLKKKPTTMTGTTSFPQRDKEGPCPSCCVIAISTRRGGPAPSPSCSCFLFDATRRGMPLVVALLPFQHDGVGTGPPCCVLLSFLTRRGGQAPPCVVAHFDATGRVLPSLSWSLIFTIKVI